MKAVSGRFGYVGRAIKPFRRGNEGKRF